MIWLEVENISLYNINKQLGGKGIHYFVKYGDDTVDAELKAYLKRYNNNSVKEEGKTYDKITEGQVVVVIDSVKEIA